MANESLATFQRLVQGVRAVPGDGSSLEDWRQWCRSSEDLVSALLNEVDKESGGERGAAWECVRELLERARAFCTALGTFIEQSASRAGH